jgi:thymidylate synthase (FAD)
MKIVEPEVIVVTPINGEEIMKRLEIIGRVCYKSEDKITDESCEDFISKIVKREHLSVLEHVNVTFRIITNRGVTHELVRHRIASYSQESTRYVKYANGEMRFVKPFWYDTADEPTKAVWRESMLQSELSYNQLLDYDLTVQAARGVLPNDLRTEIVVTTNLREWMHIIKLRTAAGAHPDIVIVIKKVQEYLQSELPIIFGTTL